MFCLYLLHEAFKEEFNFNKFESLQWALSVDVMKNDMADANVVVNKDASWTEQEGLILKS